VDACSYRFEPVLVCNMCGQPESGFLLLGRRLNRSQGAWPRSRTGVATSVCRCRRCGLIFSNPQPTPPTINVHYDVPPEQYLNNATPGIDDESFAEELAWLHRLEPIVPGMRSLDVGAGIGKAMAVMARRGFDAYGFEPSRTFYGHAIENTGLSQDKLSLATIETAEYPDQYFDFINFRAVLEHVYSPSASLARALRWLKPEGLILVEVPSARWLISRAANIFYRLSATDYVANLSPMHPPFHLYEFTVKSFVLHGAASGYVVADHRHQVCETYLPAVLRSIASMCMSATGTGMQLSVWLRKSSGALRGC
jgi:2-polyprenyl-3-methyl-5-hydroxy-6-metoxy-1,4-benzoquinol methylase